MATWVVLSQWMMTGLSVGKYPLLGGLYGRKTSANLAGIPVLLEALDARCLRRVTRDPASDSGDSAVVPLSRAVHAGLFALRLNYFPIRLQRLEMAVVAGGICVVSYCQRRDSFY